MAVMRQDEMKQRIALASPAQLVVITYEILCGHLAESARLHGSEGFPEALEKARACLNELSAALNLEIPVSAELLQIYIYMNKLLIRAQMENAAEHVAEAQKIAQKLLDGWCEIAAAPEGQGKEKAMYAGLTYTKDGALSEYDPDETGRGYRV